jgi:TetR/AcrR family transcriptional regulator of autoinduction and epiphytic fitness
MSKKDRNSRRYDATRRLEQARQTRQTITEAARKLFVERGYAGATISAIAQEAGVAAETVYASFGSKRAILFHLVDVSVVGDDQPVALLDRPFVHETEQEPDQRQQIGMFARQMCAVMERMAPIFDVMHTAAKTEPDIAEMRAAMLHERRQGMMHFVWAVAAHGPLREGLNLKKATDSVFALSSGEMFTVLTADLDWSSDQYVAWLTETLIATLLP